MAIPLSNEMKEVRAPRTANVQAVNPMPAANQMAQAQSSFVGALGQLGESAVKARQKYDYTQDAFKRNEAERKYNERTSELNTILSEKEGEERVKFQPKYEAEMKLAQDTYEAAINKVSNFDIREGSKRHINAWNIHNAQNYQYQNYQNETNLMEKTMGQSLLANNRNRIGMVDKYQTPDSLITMAKSDAFGFSSDEEKIRQFYGVRKGEPQEVVDERVRDFKSKGALAMAMRYAQVNPYNSARLSYDAAEKAYVGTAKALGLPDEYTIDGRRTLQQAKIDTMAKDPRERALMMTNGEWDPAKSHELAPDLTYEERQKIFSNSQSGSAGGGLSGVKPVSAASAEDVYVQMANVDDVLFEELLKNTDYSQSFIKMLNGTDWMSKYGDNSEDFLKQKRDDIRGYWQNNGGKGAQMAAFTNAWLYTRKVLNSGNLSENDKKVVGQFYNSMTRRLNESISEGDFTALLGNNEVRRGMPLDSQVFLTSIEQALNKQGGQYRKSHWYNPFTWGKGNRSGRATPDSRIIETAAANSLKAWDDMMQHFGLDNDATVGSKWFTTPQAMTAVSTSSSVDNMSGEKKSVTSASPQQMQVIPAAYFVQNLLERNRQDISRPFVLDDNKVVAKAATNPSQWDKRELDLYKGFTDKPIMSHAQQYVDNLLEKKYLPAARETLQKTRNANPFGVEPPVVAKEKDVQALAWQMLRNDMLSNPEIMNTGRLYVLAKQKAEEADRKDGAEAAVKLGKAAASAPELVNLSDLGLHGVIGEKNSKPAVLASNGMRLQELDNDLFSYGIQNVTYTSAMGGKHAAGEKSHSAGHKIDFMVADGQRLPADLEQALQKAGFWGPGTGAVGWEDHGNGKGHYDVNITTPKGYQAPAQVLASTMYAKTPLNLLPADGDSKDAIKFKNIFKDYSPLGTGEEGMLTEEEFKRSFMGVGSDSTEYSNYRLRRNADRQTQQMYNDLFAEVSNTNIGALPRIFDISQAPGIEDIVVNKYKADNLDPAASRYVQYVENAQVFEAANSLEVGYAQWAGKHAGLYSQAAKYPSELRNERGLFLTGGDKHYYYDGSAWRSITGDPGRILSFMAVLDQNEPDLSTDTPYSILSRSLSAIEYTQRNEAKYVPAYNVRMGDVSVTKFPDFAYSSFKNISTTDWRK